MAETDQIVKTYASADSSWYPILMKIKKESEVPDIDKGLFERFLECTDFGWLLDFSSLENDEVENRRDALTTALMKHENAFKGEFFVPFLITEDSVSFCATEVDEDKTKWKVFLPVELGTKLHMGFPRVDFNPNPIEEDLKLCYGFKVEKHGLYEIIFENFVGIVGFSLWFNQTNKGYNGNINTFNEPDIKSYIVRIWKDDHLPDELLIFINDAIVYKNKKERGIIPTISIRKFIYTEHYPEAENSKVLTSITAFKNKTNEIPDE